MDEATKKTFFSRVRARLFSRTKQTQSGQATVEYILVLVMALVFTRFVFFNANYGFKASLDKAMLKLGVYLEQNLKTGTQIDGTKSPSESTKPYAGTNAWTN